MFLSGEAYVALTGDYGEWHPQILELEKQYNAITGEWEQQPDYLRLYNRRELRSRDRQKYQEENERLVKALKSSYRM